MKRLIINFSGEATDDQLARARVCVQEYQQLGRDGARITAKFDSPDVLFIYHGKFQQPAVYTWGRIDAAEARNNDTSS